MKVIILLSSLVLASSAFARHHMKEMPKETQDAFKSCHDEAKFEKGKRPSKEERKKFKECMKSKGIEVKDRSHHKMKDKMKSLEAKVEE